MASNTAHKTTPPTHKGKEVAAQNQKHDLCEDLEKRAGRTRSIYGSRERVPAQDQGHQIKYTGNLPVWNQHRTLQPSGLRCDTAKYRGAAHPLCFTDEVLDHEFPEGFKPVNIEAYDEMIDPTLWIEYFILHIHMAREDDLHAIKYLPLKLKGPARYWLKSLPENSIGSWEELEDASRANFQGTYVRPPDADDLSHITQQPGESARKLWNRFLTKKNQNIDCPNAEALAPFKHSVRDEWLARHLGQEKPKTMAALTTLMTRFCAGEDNWLARSSTSDPGTSEVRDGNGKPQRNKNKRQNNGESPNNTAVNATFRGSRPGQQKKSLKGSRDGPSSLDKILERSCQIHGTPNKPANHTNRECWVFKQASKLNAEHKGKAPQRKDEDESRHPNMGG